MTDETVIIGGGPAGSAAAIQLARQGMPVRLLERQPGPHHKVCGEFISFEAVQYLTHLGLDLPALGAVAIRQVRFYNGEQELGFDLPFTAWSLSRRTLDSALLKQAESAGAIVEQGTAVRQLSRVGEQWQLTTSKLSASGRENTEVLAKTLFLANGKHELRGWPRVVKGNTQANAREPRHQDFIGLKMHFSPGILPQVPRQGAVEIHLFNGGYAGLEPIEQGLVNLCFLIRQDVYKACGGNWAAVLNWLGCTSSPMKQRLAGLTPLWSEPLAVAGVPYGYIASPGEAVPALFRLGDQAGVIPSLAGDGIAIALHTALLAARVHVAGADSKTYQRQACKDLTQAVRNASLLAKLLSNPLGRKAAFALALLWPKPLREKLLQAMTRRTRVGTARDRG